MFQNKRSLGFTFIEIMIVITIIATLSAVAFFSYIQFSKKSRDTLRLSNVKEIQGGLEVYAIKMKKYPTPDASVEGNISYNGNSFAYSKVGFVKQDVASALNLKSIPLDPVYQKEIQYATLDNRKRYQLSTILESMFSSNNTLSQQTYATTQIAKLEGNYNGRFIKVSSGSTHTVISLPSLFLNNGSGSLNISVNQPVQNILVSGAPGSIDILNNTTGNTFSYTPKVIYSSSKCGVETDQEIVDFLLNLRDSYNQAPFTGLEEFRDIFNDYESIGANGKSAQDIKMAMGEIDFSTLERIGSKINDALGCEIKSFKTTDIFPETCQNNGITESGDFDGYPHGFSMSGSCLFSVTGNGTKEVRNNIGKGNSKGFYIKTINDGQGVKIKYTTFSYIPAKLSFDFQTFFASAGYGGFNLYINNTLYDSWSTTNNGNNIKTYTTEVMPPGLYTFEFRIGGSTYTQQDWVIIDNILFGCKKMGELSGESNCGRTFDFEDGGKLPWELFTFTGEVNTPWPRDNSPGASNNGDYALTSPNYMVSYKSFSMTRTEIFDQPSKYNFDYKGIFGTTSSGDDVKLIFKINGINYLVLSSKDNTINNYNTFSSPLLPAGTYNFEWIISRGNTSQNAKYYLDNIRKSCIGGGAGCGRDDSFEAGNQTPWELFTFTGTTNLPWPINNNPDHISNGSASLYTISNQGCWNSTNLIKQEIFNDYAKYSFDFKDVSIFSGGDGIDFIFYINDIEYYNYNVKTVGENPFKNIITPLLSPGNYEFKWSVKRNCNSQNTTFYIDDIKRTCIGGTGPNCSINGSFESATNQPLNLFTYSGTVTSPWLNIDTGTGITHGTYASKLPPLPGSAQTEMSYNTNLSYDGYISFDHLYNLYYSSLEIFIDDSLIQKIGSTSSSVRNKIDTPTQFTSPLLKAGPHSVKLRITKGSSTATHTSDLIVDNFKNTECSSLSTPGCSWTLGFEDNGFSPYDLFSFTGSYPFAWPRDTVSKTQGTYSIKSPRISAGTNSTLTMNRVFSQSQRLNFDLKGATTSQGTIRFYINGVEYLYFNNTIDSNFKTISTPLLPAGSYEFKWYLHGGTNAGHYSEINIDNFIFDCVGGGTNCGVTDFVGLRNSIELGDVPIFNVFSFTGFASIPWKLTNNVGSASYGSYGLESPIIPAGKTSDIILTMNFAQAQRLNFDIKANLSSNANITFYINDAKYDFYTSALNGNFSTFKTPLLPAGNYEFKWTLSAVNNVGHFAQMTLDNLLLDCVGGGTNCGITNFVTNSNSLEIGDTPIYNIFTASGYAQTPWILTSGASNVSHGSYALKSPSVLKGKKSELILTINLPLAKKFRYSLKPNITANGTVKFYYDSTLHNSYTSSSSKTFGTITTPTLGAGSHTFRWLIEAGTYNVDDFAEIILDNLQFID